LKHFVTDRRSALADREFTLSFSSSPDRNEILQNRRLLAGAMGISDDRLYLPTQVHETNIVHVTADISRDALLNTDALVTDEAGVCLAVMSADCVPVLLYDRRNKAIAAIHAGWRGTVAKIVDKTLQLMNSKFGTRGRDLVAGIGPSVCQESYEVGEEVVGKVKSAFGEASGLMIPTTENKAMLDLWKANKIQLLEFGVGEADIEISNLCTVKKNEYFFSARKGDTGRFAAGIMMQ